MDTSPVCQMLKCFRKFPALPLHCETEDISPVITFTKAAPGLSIRKYYKCGCVYVMVKGAKSGIVSPCPAQFHAFRYQVNDINPIFDFVRNAHKVHQQVFLGSKTIIPREFRIKFPSRKIKFAGDGNLISRIQVEARKFRLKTFQPGHIQDTVGKPGDTLQ